MKKLINLLLVLAAVAALVVTAIELKRLLASAKKSNDARTAVMEKNAVMKARIDTLKSAGAQQARTASGKEALAKAVAKGKAEGKQPVRTQARQNPIAEFMAEDREFALKYYAHLRSESTTTHALFSRVHRLSKEQSEALAEADFQRMLRGNQMETERQETGTVANWEARRKELSDEYMTATREALGEDLYEQLKLYDSQGPAWDYVSHLGGAMSLVDIPLSMDQASRLANAMANANSSFQKGNAVDMISATTDWDAVIATAAEFLTPEQLDFFKNIDVSMSGGLLGMFNSRQQEELNEALQNLPSK